MSLLIIDEISMISNLSLMYINLRLCEIFDNTDDNDGCFGKINILLFGDLLQLPLVMQHPPFIPISIKDMNKYLKCLYTPNIWENLLTYDELTINVRQKEDSQYAKLLSSQINFV
ncbi:MAG: hypothetical protein I4N51_04290 [Acinetobacter sp.]|nr:hypothetical protein [Acinetobacter sp.]